MSTQTVIGSKVAQDVNVVGGGGPLSTIPVNQLQPAVSTTSSVPGNAASVLLLSSSADRLGASIYNDQGANTATLYVKFGGAASLTDFKIAIPPNSYYEFAFPCFTGEVYGIWSAATGNARISEEESN